MTWTMNITRPVEWHDVLKEKKVEALFHCFGVNFKELEGNAGSYTTAVIELPDGTVKNVPVEHIQFLDKEEK